MMRRGIRVLAIAALVLIGGVAGAWAQQQCDFVTGGGDIITTAGGTHGAAKANFGVGGSCKQGGDDHGLWGHLEYIDHGTGLNVHWTSITGYFNFGDDPPDPKTGQPRGGRLICGTARTNTYGDVNWGVYAKDTGEPGRDDVFIIRLTQPVVAGAPQVIVYTTEGDSDHTLGGPGPGGGNIQLHKPNPSTSGDFGGSCPAVTDVP